MEQVYREVAKQVADKYVEFEQIPAGDCDDAVEACVKHLATLNMNVRLVRSPMTKHGS